MGDDLAPLPPCTLDAETQARLIARHGSLDAAVRRLMADPRYGPQLDELLLRCWLKPTEPDDE